MEARVFSFDTRSMKNNSDPAEHMEGNYKNRESFILVHNEIETFKWSICSSWKWVQFCLWLWLSPHSQSLHHDAEYHLIFKLTQQNLFKSRFCCRETNYLNYLWWKKQNQQTQQTMYAQILYHINGKDGNLARKQNTWLLLHTPMCSIFMLFHIFHIQTLLCDLHLLCTLFIWFVQWMNIKRSIGKSTTKHFNNKIVVPLN